MRKPVVHRFLFVAVMFAVSTVDAQQTQPMQRPRIDSQVHTAFVMRDRALRHGESRRESVSVLITLHRAQDVIHLRQLATHGVTLSEVGGRVVQWHEHVAADVTREGVLALSQSAFVKRVRSTDVPTHRPLEPSSETLGVDAARAFSSIDSPLTGDGVTIADIDSAVDLFHPAFFRADAGWFDWIDTNGNGVLDPEVDAIDLNANGVVDETEIARVLRAEPISENDGLPASAARPLGFDPGLDWVYLDENDDGERNVREGFEESTPAYGEPLFTPDDVNGNGRVDLSERVVRLGTSKISRYLVRTLAANGTTVESIELVRGENLIESRRDYQENGFSEHAHATSVIGILSADIPLPHRKWVGIAPDADIVLVYDAAGYGVAGLMWALNQTPDVVLHEYVNWTNVPLDGSDATSALIDESANTEDVAHVCPAGNIGDGRMHTRLEIPPGESVEAQLNASSEATYYYLTLIAPIDAELQFELVESDETVHLLGDSVNEPLSTGGVLVMVSSATDRGFRQLDGYVDELTSGQSATIRVTNLGTSSARVHGYVEDEGSFNGYTTWEIADASYTLSWPAAADNCLAVGAVAAFDDEEISEWSGYEGSERAGVLREYSSRGPRIDEQMRPHVLAPDNPWSTVPEGRVYPPEYADYDYPQGAYTLFGGTSGAAPHVAATAALLAQKGVRGLEARTAIIESVSPIAGAPNSDVGYGALDTASAIGTSRDNSAPTVSLSIDDNDVRVGDVVHIVAHGMDADGDALQVRWDDGYNGSFDTPLAPLAPHAMTIARVGTHRVKAFVRDATGRIAEAAFVFTASEADAVSDGCDCRAANGSRRSAELAWLGVLVLGFYRRLLRSRA